MGLVLWIDQNTFASNLVERVFKKEGLEFYSLSRAVDFLYLIEDLKPAILVLDPETLARDRESVEKTFRESELLRKIPALVLGSWEGMEFVENRRGILPRTFDPFKIPAMIREFSRL